MARGHLVLEHSIDAIHVGHQYRRELGDLAELRDSIERVGLLSPIVLTPENVLISGNRRLAVMRELGRRTVPVWIAAHVSDKLSTILAIQDENTLHKSLAPIEQATLYAELKELYADEASRREAATHFGSPDRQQHLTPSVENSGGVDSTPPQPPSGGGAKSRVQAAKAVTGRDSHGMLEQVVELQTIAASDEEADTVRQLAAEALVELNQDGKVNGRYLHVKVVQALTTLARLAEDPDTGDDIRKAATAEIATIRAAETPKLAAREASAALARIAELQRNAAAMLAPVGWADIDPFLREKHEVRKLVDLLRREHGWWTRNNPETVGAHADPAQWDLIESYIQGAAGFLERALAGRCKTEPDRFRDRSTLNS